MPMLMLIAASLAPAAAPAEGEPARKGDRLVCRTLPDIGSRLSERRVCMRRDQWAEHRRLQRAELLRTQGRLNDR